MPDCVGVGVVTPLPVLVGATETEVLVGFTLIVESCGGTPQFLYVQYELPVTKLHDVEREGFFPSSACQSQWS